MGVSSSKLKVDIANDIIDSSTKSNRSSKIISNVEGEISQPKQKSVVEQIQHKLRSVTRREEKEETKEEAKESSPKNYIEEADFSHASSETPQIIAPRKKSVIEQIQTKLKSIVGAGEAKDDDPLLERKISKKVRLSLAKAHKSALLRIEARARQKGVRAEKLDENTKKEIKKIEKSEKSRILIEKALRTNALFVNMQENQINAIIDAMDRTAIPNESYICKFGEAAKIFYTIESGSFEVYVPAIVRGQKIMKKLRDLSEGEAFGEAFLFNVKRTASVKAVEDSVVWGISRPTFRQILKSLLEQESKEIFEFLDVHLSFLKEVGENDIQNFRKSLEIQTYKKGDRIVTNGCAGDGFYVVYQGQVRVYVDFEERKKTKELQNLGKTMDGPNANDSWSRFVDIPRVLSSKRSIKLTIKHSHNNLTGKAVSLSNNNSFVNNDFSELYEIQGELVVNVGKEKEKISNKKGSISAKQRAESAVGVYDLEILNPGQFFGERSLLTEEDTAASCEAFTEEVKVIKIDKYFFMRYLSGIPSISERSRKEYGILILKSVPLLQELTSEQRKLIIPLFERRAYSVGEYLILQGDESRSFFILSDGEVEIEQSIVIPKNTYNKNFDVQEGKIVSAEEIIDEKGLEFMKIKIVMGRMQIGNYFGESGLYHNEERNVSVKAITDVKCLCLNKVNFAKLMEMQNENNKDKMGTMLEMTSDDTDKAKMTCARKRTQLLMVDGLPKFANVMIDAYNIEDFIAYPEVLGSGAFGEVRVIKNKHTQQLFAGKIVRKSLMPDPEMAFEMIKQEVKVMSEIEASPFIVNLYKSFKGKNALYLVSDLVAGQELYAHLNDQGRNLSPTAQRFYIANIVLMLRHLHKQHVAYRDLKPENVVIDSNGYMKLIDFGFARRVLNRTWTFCGSPDYLAPEVLSCVGHDINVDWWSLGVVAFEILVGVTPFHDPNSESPYLTYSNILVGKIIAKAHSDADKNLLDFIDKLLQNKKANRLGSHGAEDVMSHPYFRDLDWKNLENQTLTPPWIPGNALKESLTAKDEEWIPLSIEGSDLQNPSNPDWFYEV